jgi:hypothetical protein
MAGSAFGHFKSGNAGSSHRDGNCFAVLADCVHFGKRLIEMLLVPPDRQNKAPARRAGAF